MVVATLAGAQRRLGASGCVRYRTDAVADRGASSFAGALLSPDDPMSMNILTLSRNPRIKAAGLLAALALCEAAFRWGTAEDVIAVFALAAAMGLAWGTFRYARIPPRPLQPDNIDAAEETPAASPDFLDTQADWRHVPPLKQAVFYKGSGRRDLGHLAHLPGRLCRVADPQRVGEPQQDIEFQIGPASGQVREADGLPHGFARDIHAGR